MGERQVLVSGSGSLGCVSSELAANSRNGECADEAQQASAIYNPLLVQMLAQLNKKLGPTIFIAADPDKMQKDFINEPQAFGFETSKEACCGQGTYSGLGVFSSTYNLCPNINVYAFWDAFHPTKKANRIIVQQMMTASTEYMSPMNLSTIIALDSRV